MIKMNRYACTDVNLLQNMLAFHYNIGQAGDDGESRVGLHILN